MSNTEETPVEESILYSRSGTSSPFGKNTEEVKARIPFELKEGFTRIAHELGMNESELLRELIMIRVLGFDMVKKIHEERFERVAGIGNK